MNAVQAPKIVPSGALPHPWSALDGLLTTRALGRHAAYTPETGSTNRDALALAPDAPTGTAVLTDHQTAGRGRMGRAWTASVGENLLVSLVLRPALAPEHRARVTLAAATALADALPLVDARLAARLKWPNDVRVGGGKVAGILAEASGSVVVLGVGVNVNQAAFPVDLAGTATSLAREAGRAFDRVAVFAAFLNALEPLLALAETDPAALLDRYRAHLSGVGERVTLYTAPGAAPLTGTFTGVTDEGALRLRTDDGAERTFHAGDVTTHAPDAP